MESLVAWVKVTQKKRLRVVDLDADRSPELVHHLAVGRVPSLLVLETAMWWIDWRVVRRAVRSTSSFARTWTVELTPRRFGAGSDG